MDGADRTAEAVAGLRRAAAMGSVPRGELWVYDRVLGDLHVSCNLGEHALLRRAAGMDLWFFPVGEGEPAYPGYRTFRPDEMGLLADLPPPRLLGLVVDGPLEREIRRVGLEGALEPLAVAAAGPRPTGAFDGAVDDILSLVRASADVGVAVVVADDLAGRDGPLAHPAALRAALMPAYARLAAGIRATGRLALFHSDGAVAEVAGLLAAAGFDGLAGYQIECYDASRAPRGLGRDWLLIGGLPAAWTAEGPPAAAACRAHLRHLSRTAGPSWALATSTGIGDGVAWRNLLRCYAALDAACRDAGPRADAP